MSRTSPMISFSSFFFNDTAPTEIYTLSLHDALPISVSAPARALQPGLRAPDVARPSASVLLDRVGRPLLRLGRSEEHTSELQSPMYLVCRLLLEKKKTALIRTAIQWQNHFHDFQMSS